MIILLRKGWPSFISVLTTVGMYKEITDKQNGMGELISFEIYHY